MISRLLRGLLSLSKRGFKAVGYYKYTAVLGTIALVLSIRRRARIRKLSPANPSLLSFASFTLPPT